MRLPFSVLGVALPGEIRNSASRGVCGSLPRPKNVPLWSLRDCARASAGTARLRTGVSRSSDGKATHTQHDIAPVAKTETARHDPVMPVGVAPTSPSVSGNTASAPAGSTPARRFNEDSDPMLVMAVCKSATMRRDCMVGPRS